MKLYRSLPLYVLLLIVFALSSCLEEPEFPAEPRLVGIESIIFEENPEPGAADTLSIRVEFEDGDGDLGLLGSGADVEPPYHEIDIVEGPDGYPIRYDAKIHGAFNCKDYYPVNDTAIVIDNWILELGDTVLIEYNKFGRNFDIQLLIKEQEEFVEYDFRARCVAPLGGRFMPLKDDFSNKKPLKGILEYKAVSSALLLLFRNDTLKVRVQIRDRALNESNVVESKAFTLRDGVLPD